MEEVWVTGKLRRLARQKAIYITFTSYLKELHETMYFALQVKRTSSLPTVRDQADIVK